MTEPKKQLTKAAKKALEDFEVAANEFNNHSSMSVCVNKEEYLKYKEKYEEDKAKLIKHMLK